MKKYIFAFLFIFTAGYFAVNAIAADDYFSDRALTNRLIENIREEEQQKSDIQYLIFFVLPAVYLGYRWAKARGRSPVAWALLCALLSYLGLIILRILPSMPTPDTHVLCPDCREPVLKDARACKHCGCKLVPVSD
jgi:hypothetical protein